FALDHKFGKCSHLSVKNSVSYFNRAIISANGGFDGSQTSSFTELTYANHGEKMEWITGLNYFYDAFKEDQSGNAFSRNYNLKTPGIFVQNNWIVNKQLNIETGLRGDYVVDYEFVVLPRISALFKINSKLS